ncbi:hypothetical protein M409DRAFT_23119 [Zasmidium cellare ATCC 36951]|uniref:F-box domain-containing protein n=1 Tax=Zasmidium cellare ATCC 36951 TaxID=1080233 RepID=A0A6A6CHE9_ZASCE|nr:uncharacterized protein M409DRAFT_23119 [Zasmidium cellare ATCC 36951]KAF2166481.1 hypothetical protein M409DRAFT_23119 [Zasmidium cellare ATCC 36951]
MAATDADQKCSLKGLPAEIRNDIFALALTEDRPLAVCTDDCPRMWSQTPRETKLFYALPRSKQDLRVHYDKYGARDDIGLKGFWLLWLAKLEKRPAVPALALTCPQFFREAMPVFYAVNEFVLSRAYSEVWSTALFEVLKRLVKLNEMPKQTMPVRRVCIHVENCDNESVPSTEDAGRVYITHDLISGRLHISPEGMFEGLCLCAVHNLAAGLRGEECIEEFVRLFEEHFYPQLVNHHRSGILLRTRCERCGSEAWETWETFCIRTGRGHLLTSTVAVAQGERTRDDDRALVSESRQSDIRDYFVRP